PLAGLPRQLNFGRFTGGYHSAQSGAVSSGKRNVRAAMERRPRRLRDSGQCARSGLSRPLGKGSRRGRLADPGATGERFLMNDSPRLSTLARGRLCIVLGAMLWSLGGAFNKVLTKPSPLGLDEPAVHNLQIACFRILF